MLKYYYLISSLPELVFEGENFKNVDFLKIRDYILEHVSEKDSRYVINLLNVIDNSNLLDAFFDKNRERVQGGQFQFHSIDDLDKSALPLYMRYFIERMEEYKAEHKSYLHKFAALQYLSNVYYTEMEKSDNKFISKWFKFDKEVRNIQTAYLCRKRGVDIDEFYLIGRDDMTKSLQKNTSPDFGLSRIRDYIPELLQAFETPNIVAREIKLDALRWKQIDEINLMEYFSIDVALGVLQKAYIADRWLALDKERGKLLFRKLVDDLIKKDDKR
jgi:hypothetical protein